jgi:molybdopterin synthase catalytic subunit
MSMGPRSCALHDGPLPLSLCSHQAIIDPGRGAVASFLGVVRAHARGRSVQGLYYEAYRPMALAQLERLAQEAQERFDPELAVSMVHGLGAMRPGEVSVCILAASAHRDPALDAVAHLIERLKEDLPVWKRQTFADGEVEWVAGS